MECSTIKFIKSFFYGLAILFPNRRSLLILLAILHEKKLSINSLDNYYEVYFLSWSKNRVLFLMYLEKLRWD